MKCGKVKESILRRSVLKQLHHTGTDGSPAYGEDAGTLYVEELKNKSMRIAVQINPVEGWTLCAERAVYGAVASLWSAGSRPEAISVMVLMPEDTQEKALKALMSRFDALCEQEDIALIAGHTAVSSHVDTVILSVTGIGIKVDAEDKGLCKSMGGLDLLVVDTVGREGTALLAREHKDALLMRYPESFLKQAEQMFDTSSCGVAGPLLWKNGALRIHDLSEGGVFAGLWELASACKVGLEVDLKSIPIKQHTIEVCEFFRCNPYMLFSSGSLLAIMPDGQNTVRQLAELGIEAAVIGKTTDGNDRIIKYDDEIRFLEPPKPDVYYEIKRSFM